MLQALQAADLIRREPDPADARCKCIVCTEKAEAFRPACPQEITETEAMLLRDISPEERDTFMRIGLKMLSNFEKNDCLEKNVKLHGCMVRQTVRIGIERLFQKIKTFMMK